MTELLRELCCLHGASGNEDAVREFIIEKIKDHCEYRVDKMGNIIAHKKGKKTSANKIMVDAHMDEVGLIITNIDDNGFLRFECVGGIDAAVILARRVWINGTIPGVIGLKPVHLTDKEDAKKYPDKDNLYIDIGATDKAQALKKVSLGDFAVFDSEFVLSGDIIKAKAIDDRAGCAVLIKILREDADYDFTATFTVQEEIGCRGAKVAAFAIDPDFAIILEATTAADIADVAQDKRVCALGDGPAVSFMDKSTLYDRALYNYALNCQKKCQPKAMVSGGNNSGAVHLSREGVRTMAISLPCRYIHSPSCVANINDINGMYDLVRQMITAVGNGEV